MVVRVVGPHLSRVCNPRSCGEKVYVWALMTVWITRNDRKISTAKVITIGTVIGHLGYDSDRVVENELGISDF